VQLNVVGKCRKMQPDCKTSKGWGFERQSIFIISLNRPPWQKYLCVPYRATSAWAATIGPGELLKVVYLFYSS
jgi:hypothetical protein